MGFIMNKDMLPENSPKNTRRVNAVPLIIFITILSIFIGFLVYGGWANQQAQEVEKKQETQKVEASDKNTVDMLLNSYTKEPEKTKEEIKPAPLDNSRPIESEPAIDETKQERLRQIAQQRQQRFETAVGAKTMVDGDWMSKKDEDKKNVDVAALAALAKQENKWSLSAKVEAPETEYLLRAGHVLPGVMVTGINSELAGTIIGQVSQDIYDTASGKHLLIPQGTKILGTYNNEIIYGQDRLSTVLNRLTFPDGKVVDIGEMLGSDLAGYSGYEDKVNHHYFKTFGNAILMSAVIGLTALSQNQNQGQSQGGGFNQNSNSILSQSLGQTMGQTTQQLLQRNLSLAPTIEIRPGYEFNIILTKDIKLPGVYQGFDYQQ